MLLRDAGLWRERERERETHIHGWPMLSYLSRFQILDGSPALEHLLSMRKSLIHLPSVPDPLPSFSWTLFLIFSLRDSYSTITPISLPRTYDFGTQRLDLNFSPSLSIFHRRHSCCHATYNKCAFRRARRLVLSLRLGSSPLAVAPSGG